MLKNLVALIGLTLGALTTQVAADGVDPIFDVDGRLIGDVEILGDVRDRSGREWAQFIQRDLGLLLYIPPDAAYVLMTADNPIIKHQVPFPGYWVAYRPSGIGEWTRCNGGFTDHRGDTFAVHGSLTWTNTAITPDGDLAFQIELGHCGRSEKLWATSHPKPSKPSAPPLPAGFSLDDAADQCGTGNDPLIRALGCSEVIIHPDAVLDDITWALWNRAFVSCGTLSPDEVVMADLMTAVWLDPVEWQTYFVTAGGYTGPIDGRVSAELIASVRRYVTGGCR